MRVWLNEQACECPPAGDLAALLRQEGLADRLGIAVAVNQSVIARADWECTHLAAEDQVLIIQATQGG
jgi:sulfur carrier protein